MFVIMLFVAIATKVACMQYQSLQITHLVYSHIFEALSVLLAGLHMQRRHADSYRENDSNSTSPLHSAGPQLKL